MLIYEILFPKIFGELLLVCLFWTLHNLFLSTKILNRLADNKDDKPLKAIFVFCDKLLLLVPQRFSTIHCQVPFFDAHNLVVFFEVKKRPGAYHGLHIGGGEKRTSLYLIMSNFQLALRFLPSGMPGCLLQHPLHVCRYRHRG